MRKPPKYLSLKRPKLRQSWNKHNLYNMARGTGEETSLQRGATFFQQKWSAKSRTRGYHGEHVPEKKWKRMFSRRLKMAVDMPPKYLAAHDGSEQAAGRGSGSDMKLPGNNASDYWHERNPGRSQPVAHRQLNRANHDIHTLLSEPLKNVTPLMQMTFAPLERRLDTAIFRALFATSIRQARQFVVHGAVKVNGKKMVYPSYQLNPGDMFQVQVGKVLQAIGTPQKSEERARFESVAKENEKMYEKAEKEMIAQIAYRTQKLSIKSTEGESEATAETPAKDESASEASSEEAAAKEAAEEKAEETTEEDSAPAELSLDEAGQLELRKLRLEHALVPAKLAIRDELQEKEALQKRLHDFKDRAGRILATTETRDLSTEELVSELQLEMRSLDMIRNKNKSEEEDGEGIEGANEDKKAKREAIESRKQARKDRVDEAMALSRLDLADSGIRTRLTNDLTLGEMRHLGNLLKTDAENPIDHTKPYKTPWMPRPYMAPFCFVPRYLEVNHKACAAVYLRHPVARKGSGEVPTPFSFFTSQLAHSWYVQHSGSKSS